VSLVPLGLKVIQVEQLVLLVSLVPLGLKVIQAELLAPLAPLVRPVHRERFYLQAL
jgi:hypothetical protein